LRYSISATTRQPRTGEIDGQHYFFRSDEAFQKEIETGQFLEWAEVHGARYGTPRKFVEEILSQGEDVLLAIDTQGALNVKKNFEETITTFVIPPSWEELEKRLRARGQDDEETIARRLSNARHEVTFIDQYDYVVVNSDLDRAFVDLKTIIHAERQRALGKTEPGTIVPSER
jgi:guanylate kinase